LQANWSSAEVETLLQHFAETYSVADAQSVGALVKGEMQDSLPTVADPSMWQSWEVGYLLSRASHSWHLESADPVRTFLQQLPEHQALGLTSAYTDFGA